MRWLVLWLCSCTGSGDVLAVHIANTEQSCREVGAALTQRIGGAYICARYHENLTTDEVKIWEQRK